jgi:chloramphenicol 3-O-phosphotransferase
VPEISGQPCCGAAAAGNRFFNLKGAALMDMNLTHGIYIITGIMASGKSTIAQLLAEKTDYSVHVRGDEFRRAIISGRAEVTMNPSEESAKQLLLRYKLAAHVAECYYSEGFTTIVQDNYLGNEANYFINCFSLSPVYLITLCPSVQAVASREALRNKTGYIHWNVEALNETLINDNPKIGLWIDSSNQTPEETIAEIYSRYKAEARIL